MTKNDVVLYAAIGVAVAGVYAYTRRSSQPAKAAPAVAQSPVASRRPGAITAPVQLAKPLQLKKSKSTTNTAKKAVQKALPHAANLAAQFGCSHLSGYQKTACQQGSGALMSFL